jgi:hypothetical protein
MKQICGAYGAADFLVVALFHAAHPYATAPTVHPAAQTMVLMWHIVFYSAHPHQAQRLPDSQVHQFQR